MEKRYRCTLLALRPVLFDSEVVLSQAFSSQAFSKRTGGRRKWSPRMLLFRRLSGTCPDQKPVKLVSFPDVPVGSPGELTAGEQGPCCSSSLTQKDGADPDPYLRESLSWF